MTRYAIERKKLSRDLVLKLKRNEAFDGKEGRPESQVIRDTHAEAGGLMLRLSPGGAMTYVVHGRVDKISARYYTIGDARIISLKRAREIAADFCEQMHRGKMPTAKKKVRWTFEAAYSEYIAYKKNKVKPETIKSYDHSYGKLHNWFTCKNIAEIDEERIEEEHKRITAEWSGQIADRTFNHIVLPVFRFAMHLKDEYKKPVITSNPAKIMQVKYLWSVNGGRAKRKKDSIRSSDLPALLDAIENIGDLSEVNEVYGGWDYITPFVVSRFFKFLLFTGFRPAEAAKIEWNQVSRNCDTITWIDEIALKKLKNAESHPYFPLNSEAQKCLLELREIQGGRSTWVFPSRSPSVPIKSNPTDYIKKLSFEIKKLTGKEGIEDEGEGNKEERIRTRYTCGVYRKAFQTYANSLGIDSNSIKKLVFHTQNFYDVQSGYTSENEETMREYSQRVADYILKSAGRIKEENKEDILNIMLNKGYTKERLIAMFESFPPKD